MLHKEKNKLLIQAYSLGMVFLEKKLGRTPTWMLEPVPRFYHKHHYLYSDGVCDKGAKLFRSFDKLYSAIEEDYYSLDGIWYYIVFLE